MNLRWLSTALLVFGASAYSSAQTAPVAPDPSTFPAIVANVNGTEISKTDLLRRADSLKSQLPPSEVGPAFYQRVLDDMVSGELLYQSVTTKGLVATDAEVDAELQNQSQRFGGLAAFQTALEQQGMSLDEVKADLRKELGIQKYVEGELVPQMSVTDAQKRTFYDGNTDSMQQPPQFRAAHILIQVPEAATAEQKAEAKTKAQSLRSMIEMGQDFGELAARNSGDPGSKDNGGELPWMSEGQTVPPFEAAVMALAPGEMSDVVETRFGYHIIKLLERKDGGVMPYEEVQGRIEDYLMRLNLQKRLEQEVEQLKGQAAIEVFI